MADTPMCSPLPQPRQNGKSCGMATHLKTVAARPDPLDGMSLPGWLYHDPESFEAEKRAFLRAAPQIVCHESEIATPG